MDLKNDSNERTKTEGRIKGKNRILFMSKTSESAKSHGGGEMEGQGTLVRGGGEKTVNK